MDEIKHKILTRQGGRKDNQDFFGCKETKHGFLVVVCDGMGGAKGGRTASEMAVNQIIEQVCSSPFDEADQILTDAIKTANKAIFQAGQANPDLQGMGTTVVALLIDEEKATTAHVGDSRIYQVRGSRKVFRTFDHSMVFELVKRGTLTEEQARLSAESNVILRALGTKMDVDIEITRDLPYLKGDRFLLCSDGICGAVTEKYIIKLINSNKSVDITAEKIVSTVDRIGIDNGGKHDNLTAAIVELNTNSKIKPKMDKKAKLIIGILSLLLLISWVVIAWQFSTQHTSKSDINKTDNSVQQEIIKNK